MRINRERLWTRLQSLGGVGSDPQGGVSRFAWTPEYREACRILMGWMEEAGLTVRMDGVGNILGRMEGKQDLPAILTGSHFDTVPNGGRFDGMAGVMAALELLTTLHESGYIPERPIEMVAFVNEEASQFLGGTFGSKAMCGVLPSDYTSNCLHRYTGQPLREAMLEFDMNLDPDHIEKSRINPCDYLAFLELHIEQGKYLLNQDLPLAVITSVAGIRQFYITLKGVSAHAGGMAMEDRHDTLMAAAAIACEVERLALCSGSNTRGTVGYIQSHPAEHNIIADESVIPVDYREDDDAIWADYYDKLIHFVEEECAKRGLEYTIRTTIDLRPAHCHPQLIKIMEEEAASLEIPHTQMVSYPCHDSVNFERIMPMGMIFLRSSNGGLSHCPQEYTTPEDMEAGTNLLLNTILKLSETENLD
ncbi:M20 family metallo-hydrolase [Enterocloster lavalensis]|uniref:M20 family metallo-hydrolase n=1 Tax=Enterocloster lavalensis TaxID=460384 RepID=UPI0023F3D48A|nr:M20 family metallo-hydrolase [Enterocloster lavalensis]